MMTMLVKSTNEMSGLSWYVWAQLPGTAKLLRRHVHELINAGLGARQNGVDEATSGNRSYGIVEIGDRFAQNVIGADVLPTSSVELLVCRLGFSVVRIALVREGDPRPGVDQDHWRNLP